MVCIEDFVFLWNEREQEQAWWEQQCCISISISNDRSMGEYSKGSSPFRTGLQSLLSLEYTEAVAFTIPKRNCEGRTDGRCVTISPFPKIEGSSDHPVGGIHCPGLPLCVRPRMDLIQSYFKHHRSVSRLLRAFESDRRMSKPQMMTRSTVLLLIASGLSGRSLQNKQESKREREREGGLR